MNKKETYVRKLTSALKDEKCQFLTPQYLRNLCNIKGNGNIEEVIEFFNKSADSPFVLLRNNFGFYQKYLKPSGFLPNKDNLEIR